MNKIAVGLKNGEICKASRPVHVPARITGSEINVYLRLSQI